MGPAPLPTPSRAQQSLLLFCRALQKCLLGWVRAGLPGNSVTASGPNKQWAKMPLLGPRSNLHTLWGLPLIHSPLDTVYFWIRGSPKTRSGQAPLGGGFVQPAAPSFTSRSSCSRSGPAELLKISKRYHRNLETFQCLTTFTGKISNLSALSTCMVCPRFSACPCPLSEHRVMQAFQRCLDVISPEILLGLWHLLPAASAAPGHRSCPILLQKWAAYCTTEQVCFRRSWGQSTESTTRCDEAWIY